MTRLVAEALPRTQRLRLLTSLWRRGYTDEQIADALTYTTYTAARIRRSLGLAPNPRSAPQWPSAAASASRSSAGTTTPAGTAERTRPTYR